jgi:type II secretory pathway component GspD/PulD (secretin)
VRVEEVLKTLDVPKAGDAPLGRVEETPQLEVYSITTAEPQAVLAVMQTLLAGLPDVRLALDAKTGNLIALARPAEHATIRATLDQLQRDARHVEVFRLRVVDPQQAAVSINRLFGGGDPAKGAATPHAPQVEADINSHQLLVRGTTAQIEQIRTLLEKMGERDTAATAEQGGSNVRMIPLKGRAAQSALERIQEIWPALRENKIRVVTPSGEIPSVRASGTAEWSHAENDAEEPGSPSPRRKTEGTENEREPTKPPPAEPSSSAGERPAAELPAPDKSAALRGRGEGGRSLGFGRGATPGDGFAEGSFRNGVTMHLVSQPGTVPPAAKESNGENTTTVPAGSSSPSQPTNPRKEPPPIVVAPGPGGILIACEDPEALDEFERLLNTLASTTATTGPEITVFYLKHAKATAVAETLDHIFGGGTTTANSSATSAGGGGGSLLGELAGAALGERGGLLGSLLGLGEGATVRPTGTVKITPDSRLNALVVQANAADTALVEQLVKILDQKGSPEDILVVPKAKMIALKNTQAQEVAEILKQVYQDRMVAATTPGGARPPTPQEFMQMLRGSRRGGGSGGQRGTAEELQRMTVSVDARTNSIILAAPEPLFSEVQSLIEQLDLAALKSNETLRVVTLRRASSTTVQQALSAIVGDGVQFGQGRPAMRPQRPTAQPGLQRPGAAGATATGRGFTRPSQPGGTPPPAVVPQPVPTTRTYTPTPGGGYAPPRAPAAGATPPGR